MTISNSMIHYSPWKIPPFINKEMRCDLINRIPKVTPSWRGKINGNTFQTFDFGKRHYRHIKEILNEGAYKVCKKAISSSGLPIARLITKFNEQDDLRKINLHRNYMELLPHLEGIPGIVKHFDHAITRNKKGTEKITYYEECYSNDLFDCLDDPRLKPLDSKQRNKIAISLLKTLTAMHEKKIYHRDLKEENILIDFKKEPGYQVALCDLDSSWMEEVSSEEHLISWVGTVDNFSPEIALAYYNARRVEPEELAANDVWAMGHILLYLYFRAIVPARKAILEIEPGGRLLATACLTKRKRELFPEPEPHTKTHVIWQMIQIDPKKRISAQEALSGFLKNGEGDDKCSSVVELRKRTLTV